jgi:ATP-dependent RNA helicase SUPV3L1/SUV3
MEGLGYRAARGERPKQRAAADTDTPAEGAADGGGAETAEAPTDAPGTGDAPTEDAAGAGDAATPDETLVAAEAEAVSPPVDDGEPETEVFYTFTWGGNRAPRREGKPEGRQGGKPRGKGKPKGDRKGKPGGARGEGGGRSFESRPPKTDRIDPDNPFAAALMGLKTKD